jgi:serine kinase of HPr protein (carbohydrate metabolism regulator)
MHATCLAIAGQGLLILGRPGAGKSDIALRLIDEPGYGLGKDLRRAELVADDQVLIRRDGAVLRASAPAATIAGKLEIRGLGIVDVPYRESAELAICVRFAPASEIDRMPPPAAEEILGIALPVFLIDPASPSAPARIRAALDWHNAR